MVLVSTELWTWPGVAAGRDSKDASSLRRTGSVKGRGTTGALFGWRRSPLWSRSPAESGLATALLRYGSWYAGVRSGMQPQEANCNQSVTMRSKWAYLGEGKMPVVRLNRHGSRRAWQSSQSECHCRPVHLLPERLSINRRTSVMRLTVG